MRPGMDLAMILQLRGPCFCTSFLSNSSSLFLRGREKSKRLVSTQPCVRAGVGVRARPATATHSGHHGPLLSSFSLSEFGSPC